MEFYFREDAENAMNYVNSTRLDDRIIRTDWDAGFVEGRQYGRGKNGGQVRNYVWWFMSSASRVLINVHWGIR